MVEALLAHDGGARHQLGQRVGAPLAKSRIRLSAEHERGYLDGADVEVAGGGELVEHGQEPGGADPVERLVCDGVPQARVDDIGARPEAQQQSLPDLGLEVRPRPVENAPGQIKVRRAVGRGDQRRGPDLRACREQLKHSPGTEGVPDEHVRLAVEVTQGILQPAARRALPAPAVVVPGPPRHVERDTAQRRVQVADQGPPALPAVLDPVDKYQRRLARILAEVVTDDPLLVHGLPRRPWPTAIFHPSAWSPHTTVASVAIAAATATPSTPRAP